MMASMMKLFGCLHDLKPLQYYDILNTLHSSAWVIHCWLDMMFPVEYLSCNAITLSLVDMMASMLKHVGRLASQTLAILQYSLPFFFLQRIWPIQNDAKNLTND